MENQDTRDNHDTGQQLRILLIDDSKDNRILVHRFLKGTSHLVDDAENGVQAVNMAAKHPYDLILMDYHMPVMDGVAATKAIRAREQNEGLSPVLIVALTASATKEEVQSCLDAGCDRYLSKPVKKSALLELLDELLAGGAGQDGGAGKPGAPETHDSTAAGSGNAYGFDEADFLTALIPGYLKDKRQDCQKILKAVEDEDFETARLLGHSMRGSGTGYGFDEISKIGGLIEKAAKKKKGDFIRLALKSLNAYLDKTEKDL